MSTLLMHSNFQFRMHFHCLAWNVIAIVGHDSDYIPNKTKCKISFLWSYISVVNSILIDFSAKYLSVYVLKS